MSRAEFGGCLLASMMFSSAVSAQQSLDRTVLPTQEPDYPPITELDTRNATPPPRFEVKAPEGAPNVPIVLIDNFVGLSSYSVAAPQATIGHMLRKAGYYTAYKGKWHLNKEFDAEEPTKFFTKEMDEYGFSDYVSPGDLIAHTLGGYEFDNLIAGGAPLLGCAARAGRFRTKASLGVSS